jgi:hypothetical protein
VSRIASSSVLGTLAGSGVDGTVRALLAACGELTAADVLEIANAAEPAVNHRPKWHDSDPDPVPAAEWTLPEVPAGEIERATWVDQKAQR